MGKVLANGCKKDWFDDGCFVASFDEAIKAFQEEWDTVGLVGTEIFCSVCHAEDETS